MKRMTLKMKRMTLKMKRMTLKMKRMTLKMKRMTLKMKRMTLSLLSLLVLAMVMLASCSRDAKIASHNLSEAADDFQLDRRIIFFNGITDKYLLTITGKCSIEDQRNQLEVTCKVGENQYKKHFLGLSDNVSYLVEQLNAKGVSVYHYSIVFKPQSIIPDVKLKLSNKEPVQSHESDGIEL